MGRQTVGAAFEALIVLFIVFGMVLGFALATGGDPGGQSVLAAKGGAGKGSITVPDGVYGGTTTATVKPGGAGTMAFAQCYQGSTLVYAQYVEVDATNHATFKLGPTPMWTGGGASCKAEEGYFGGGGRWRTVASTTFSASD